MPLGRAFAALFLLPSLAASVCGAHASSLHDKRVVSRPAAMTEPRAAAMTEPGGSGGPGKPGWTVAPR